MSLCVHVLQDRRLISCITALLFLSFLHLLPLFVLVSFSVCSAPLPSRQGKRGREGILQWLVGPNNESKSREKRLNEGEEEKESSLVIPNELL